MCLYVNMNVETQYFVSLFLFNLYHHTRTLQTFTLCR